MAELTDARRDVNEADINVREEAVKAMDRTRLQDFRKLLNNLFESGKCYRIRRRQEEEDLKKSISDQCARHGFTCRFLYQSVIITTPLADWCFDYHEKYKTLYHENTPNTKYLTGHYVKAHTQFKGKKMTVSAVIEYIASHEGWRAEQRSKTTKEKSE